ncbi:MAG: hypothetical protein NVV73_10975 [Cellvibrionaceae bacterium]|nr:hypothetical protein [Cellvibrionaceae bacterium]
MKTLIATLALLSLSISCFAEITIDDLPYIEGTPLVERVDDIPIWSVLDYAEEDGIVQWAWLDNLGQLAYLAYPSSTDAVIFPDGFELSKSPENIVISIRAGESQDWHFTRFGGEVVVRGADVDVPYLHGLAEETTQGNTYQLHDTRTLNLSGNATALFDASGQILAIAGTESDDILQGPNAENTWKLAGESSGTLETGGEQSAPIEYSSIESLIGGSMNDTFEIYTNGVSLPSIDGNGGAMLIIADTLVPSGDANLGNGISESPWIGCSGSGLIISSDPSLSVAGSPCLIGGNFSSAIILPDIIHGEVTICRLPEPYEYTGEKKVLCGENWVAVSDDEWADLIAYSGASYLEEETQQQNPPKKRKSRGGSIPFSILHLLLLVLIFQRQSNHRSLH